MTHCEYCNTPIELWEPTLKTYRNDKSCEFYDCATEEAQELERQQNIFSFEELLERCENFRFIFPDIPDFKATVKECFDIFGELGVFTLKK